MARALRSLPALGLAGANVTVPHKGNVLLHCDLLDATARSVRAVNTIVVRAPQVGLEARAIQSPESSIDQSSDAQLVGYNTDIAGVLAAIGEEDDEPTVALFGTGGAARAALAVCGGYLHGARVQVIGRRRSAFRQMADDIRVDCWFVALDDGPAVAGAIGKSGVIINATTLGMVGQQPWPAAVIGRVRDSWRDRLSRWPADPPMVFDMVYSPLETPLLAAARADGLRTVDGLAMLIGQAAETFRLFTGVAPPRERDAELRALLTR